VQVEGREKGEPVFEFIPLDERDSHQRERRSGRGGELEKKAEALRGFAALPRPSTGDLFLDFEGDPFAFDQGLEYLIGTVTISEEGKPNYEFIWSFDPKSEKRAFMEFIERVKRARVAWTMSMSCCALEFSSISFEWLGRDSGLQSKAIRSRRWKRSMASAGQ
jgi:hypothetical protein